MIDQADNMTSSKPYLARAIYDWILDNGMTPHLVVDAGFPGTLVPMEFVDDGRIVLNISPSAVKGLVIGNDWIRFSARFSGAAREVMVPSEATLGIFARENGQGMAFPEARHPQEPPATVETGAAPKLKPVESAGGVSGSGPDTNPPRGRGGPTLKVVK
jgi:stringent starvation protein B